MDGPAVRVAVRIKPSDAGDTSRALTAVDSEEEQILIVNKGEGTGEVFQYNFWRVLEDCKQQQVYEECARSIVSGALEGQNGTIIAYGQTGAGKTYTMFGEASNGFVNPSCGIMPRAIQQVFSDLAQSMWTVRLSFIEIYNETFRDLLNPGQYSISITENERGRIGLRNVRPVEVTSAEAALHFVAMGWRNRRVSGHMMNDMSSRSHSVLTLYIDKSDLDGSHSSAKLNLVDLAGSERIKKTLVTRHMAQETQYINRSLSSLSLIVKELNRGAGHVSYRNSKLTHFLKDSLGGQCQTMMIACIWPDKEHVSETISTCRFSDDLQQVKMIPGKSPASSMESIHGKLFKMDPIVLKYIEKMTEHRVAVEMAKYQKAMSMDPNPRHLQDMESERSMEDLALSQSKELKMLRAKVERLESEKRKLMNSPELREREVQRFKTASSRKAMRLSRDLSRKSSGSISRTVNAEMRSKISETIWEDQAPVGGNEEGLGQTSVHVPPSSINEGCDDFPPDQKVRDFSTPRGCFGFSNKRQAPRAPRWARKGKKSGKGSTKKWVSSGVVSRVDALRRLFRKKGPTPQDATDFVILNSLSHSQVAAVLNAHRGMNIQTNPKVDAVSEESDSDQSMGYLPSAAELSRPPTLETKQNAMRVPRLNLDKVRK